MESNKQSSNDERPRNYDRLLDDYIKLKGDYLVLRKQYIQQGQELRIARNQYEEISNAFFWRISKPIRSIIAPIKAKFTPIRADKNNKTESSSETETLMCLFKKKHIIILSPKDTLYVAKLIKKALKQISIDSEITTEEPKIYDKYLYIVICPQKFERMPEFYISFQMEQATSALCIDDDYLGKLNNSYAIFDYSTQNIYSFKTYSNLDNLFFYLPIDSLPIVDSPSEPYEYDVVFYGDTESPRREKILYQLQKRFNVKIIKDLFSEELERELRKAKVVININYYDDSLLETVRIYEVLSVGKSVIVSERSNDDAEEKKLEGIVDFVDSGNYELLVERIDYWLSHDQERESFVRHNNDILSKRSNSFDFFFYRFLLANELISFDKFYELAGNYVTFKSNRICLSLPESLDRRMSFDHDNEYGFEVIPGLRHTRGWTGCGLSYKFIFKRAKELGFDNIIICEDDVLFPDDFNKQWAECESYLKTQKQWDVFQGLITEVENITISGVNNFQSKKFIHINRMVSMVFNYYNASVFDLVIDWDEKNSDMVNNQIDRALQRHELNIITTSPFLVGHKENLFSTIWNNRNKEQYNDLIKHSSEELYRKVKKYEKKVVGVIL